MYDLIITTSDSLLWNQSESKQFQINNLIFYGFRSSTEKEKALFF